MKKSLFTCLLFAVLLGQFGCAEKNQMRILWPPPPNESKLEWISLLRGEDDIASSGGKKFLKAFVGEAKDQRLANPFGVAVDDKGQVYVSEPARRKIVIFDQVNRKVTEFTGGNVIKTPMGMTVDSQGNLYVADPGTPAVYVFSSDRTAKVKMGSAEIFEAPAYVAVNEKLDRVYVSDAKKHQIVVFNRAGQFQFAFGQQDEVGETNLYSPQGVAIAPDGRVFVADMLNARIQSFDADGKPLSRFGVLGDHDSNFEYPKDLAFDSEGNLHIIDIRKAAMLTYSPDGKWLGYLGSGRTKNPVGFSLPVALALDNADRIYIVDRLNQRVAVWQYLSKEYLLKNPVTESDLDALRKRVRELEEKK
ncbi:MAG: NHL repeat-containing protein [Trichloromonadaceae bacterium]